MVKKQRKRLAVYSESGGLLGFLFGVATGGLGAIVLGTVGGATLGSGSVRRVDHQRFVRVLDGELGHTTIERLPIVFETMHQAREENSARVVPSRAGSVADAVGASAANPFLFEDLDPRTMPRIDPGFDRLSAVPVEAACEAHPGARLIAINLTGERALLTVGHTCEVVDVRVTVPPVDVRAMMLPGSAFRQVVEAGRIATAEALARYAAP